MMSFAAVDIGNTAIKTAIWDDEECPLSLVLESLDEVAACFRKRKVENVAYSTTRQLTSSEERLCGGEGWWKFRYGCGMPVKIEYLTPHTLGTDRLAAVIGAVTLWPERNVMVADIGTALTLDIVTADGRFAGGNICPGPQMRLDSLHILTSRLPQESIKGETPTFGYNTATALRSGAANGVVNDIAGTFVMARDIYGCNTIVLTGGGALHYLSRIIRAVEATSPQNENVRIEHEPLLVEIGLKRAYEYNHDE